MKTILLCKDDLLIVDCFEKMLMLPVKVYCRAAVSRLRPSGQTSPKAYFSTACELKMLFTDEYLQLI